MPASPQHIDKPEPRGQTIAAVLAVGAIYLALPRNVVVGPIWLLPTVIVVLLVPTVVSHRVGKQSLNRLLGFIINGITTLALIASVVLLVFVLPTHRESPLQLLRSGGLLWLTNVIVFALWVLAPGRRWANASTETTEIRQQEFRFPANANYTRRASRICVCTLASTLCRLSVRCVHAEFHLRANRRATACALGKGSGNDPDLHFAWRRCLADLGGRRRVVGIPKHGV